jgi:hypothetical protein
LTLKDIGLSVLVWRACLVDEAVLFGRFARMSIGKRRAGPDSVLVKHRFCAGEENSPRREFPGCGARWARIAACGKSCRVEGGKTSTFHKSCANNPAETLEKHCVSPAQKSVKKCEFLYGKHGAARCAEEKKKGAAFAAPF